MRNIIFIVFTLFVVGCERDNSNDSILKLKEGIYEGSFIYDTLQLWESIGIIKDSFEEYASGGVMYQKYAKYALTKGTYKIIGDSIYFSDIHLAQPPNGNPDNFEKDFLLMGSYLVKYHTDSVINFWRTAKKGKQEYNLKLFYASK